MARAETAGTPTATFTISMHYKGQKQNTALPLTLNMISQLALEASFRDQKIGELAKDLLQAVAQARSRGRHLQRRDRFGDQKLSPVTIEQSLAIGVSSLLPGQLDG